MRNFQVGDKIILDRYGVKCHGKIVGFREDKPGIFYVVYTEVAEIWIDEKNLTIDTMNTIKDSI